MSYRQSRNKKKFLELLERMPIVEIACKKAGFSRSTYYRWIKEDQVFFDAAIAAQVRGYDCVNDVAESKLIQKVHEGEWKAIAFWLESNKKRYYKPRRAIVHQHFETKNTPPIALVRFVGDDFEAYGDD